MRVLGQKKLQGGRQTPPPAFLGLKGLMSTRRDYKGLPFNELRGWFTSVPWEVETLIWAKMIELFLFFYLKNW